MVKRTIWAVVAVFIAWLALDFILHNLFLRSTYEASANLWRPADQMNLPLIYFVMFVLIGCFVLIYELLVRQKSLASGTQFGVLFGLAIGISVGFGTYIHMPIPLTLAWGWFLGGWIKAIAAGAIVGAILKDEAQHS